MSVAVKTSSEAATDSALVCHCLGVTKSQIRTTVELYGAATLDEVVDRTCAGTGCTACHCRIRKLLDALS